MRYGDRPEVRARLEQAVDNAVDQEQVRHLLDRRSLAAQTMDLTQIERIRADMERYEARRLQPYYIKSFFLEAFTALGGALSEREPGRYRITHVPARIRDRETLSARPFPYSASTSASASRRSKSPCAASPWPPFSVPVTPCWMPSLTWCASSTAPPCARALCW